MVAFHLNHWRIYPASGPPGEVGHMAAFPFAVLAVVIIIGMWCYVATGYMKDKKRK